MEMVLLITAPSTSTHRQPSLRSSSTALVVNSGGRLDRHAAAFVGSAIMLSGDQHGPDDAGHLGGIGDRGHLERAPRQQVAQPGIPGARPLVAQVRGSPQQRAQRAIALLGDAARALLAAAAELARREPEP